MEVIYRILMIVLGTWVLQYFLNKVIVVKTWYNSWVAKTFLFSGYSTIMLVGQVFTKRKKGLVFSFPLWVCRGGNLRNFSDLRKGSLRIRARCNCYAYVQ